MLKRMITVCLSSFVYFLSGCEPSRCSYLCAKALECDAAHPDLCATTFTSNPSPYPLSLQGGFVTVGTGRWIGSSETVGAVLSQGASKKLTIKAVQVERQLVEQSIRITLFQPDLMDFTAGTATLTVTITPYDGAVSQSYAVTLQLS